MSIKIERLLEDFQNGKRSRTETAQLLEGIVQLPYAQLDVDRKSRTGQAECIFGINKTSEQIIGLCSALLKAKQAILVTRVNKEKAEEVLRAIPQLNYDPIGQVIYVAPPPVSREHIAVICAGTSDLYVAQECVRTLEINGHIPKQYTDIGIAGLHRLLQALPNIKQHRILIVIAGMEGALASVIAGLCPHPIIAVPTSVGYGVHQNGLTPLHAMLSSCASGLSVVNIDNGYGAACAALRILSSMNHTA